MLETILWVAGTLWVIALLALYAVVARREHLQDKRAAAAAVRRAQQERLRQIARLPHERDGQ